MICGLMMLRRVRSWEEGLTLYLGDPNRREEIDMILDLEYGKC